MADPAALRMLAQVQADIAQLYGFTHRIVNARPENHYGAREGRTVLAAPKS
jgi:hypothetical protein